MELEVLADDDLLDRLRTLVRREREDTAAVLEHLAETDRRDLVRERGYSSLFEYCVAELGYSEPSAYHRIRAARAIKKKPDLLTLLRAGELHLEAIVLLHTHLDDDRAEELVQQARGKSKREVEAFLAPLSPRSRPRDKIQIIAVETPPSLAAKTAAAAPPQLQSHLSFCASPSLLALLERVKGLLWHKLPRGRLEDIFTEALRAFLNRKDPELWAPSNRRTRSTGRQIPKWIKLRVWKRDAGRCAYTAAGGRRCPSRSGLEFDHITPWAHGGTSNDPANIRLLCRAHNQWTARRSGLGLPKPNERPLL